MGYEKMVGLKGWPRRLAIGERGHAVGLGRVDARPPDLRVQQARGGQRDVANCFGLHAEPGPACQQLVAGVAGVEFWVVWVGLVM